MFPGARAARADAAYVVVGAPLDVSTTFQPGARFGPDRIRRFAETFDDYDHRTGRSFSELGVHDHGDVRAWDDAAAYLEYLRGAVSDVALDDAVPLLLGGEHTVTLAGVRATDPDVLVTIDAHLDLRAEYDGNPLSHACVCRRALDGGPGTIDPDAVNGADAVDGADAVNGAGAVDGADAVPPAVDELVVLGARTGSPEEWSRAEESDVTVVPPEAVGDWEPDFDGRDVYLSVDIDGADPGFAPGTGTMEPFGLAPREMRDAVQAIAPHCIAFDAVEVNDRDDGQAAALAGKLLKEFVYAHADSR